MVKSASWWAAAILCAAAFCPAAGAGEAPALLTEDQHWRAWFTMQTPVVRKDSGLEPFAPKWPYAYVCSSARPAADWAAAEFNDSEWPRWQPLAGARGEGGAFRFGFEDAGAPGPAVAAICLRGRFNVADPAQAGELKLSLTYRGGAIVFVNGQELTRAHLPKDGPLAADAVADDYQPEVFLKENKKPFRAEWGDPGKYKDVLEKRLRRIDGVVIDPKLLRPGVNTLAVEIRRAPYFGPGLQMGTDGGAWGTCGLVSIRLQSSKGPEPAARRDVLVGNHPAGQWVGKTSLPDGNEALQPLRLAGARNGAFSGQVVLAGPGAPLAGVKASVSDLKTADGLVAIPASAVQVRYVFGGGAVCDGLEEAPPAAGGLQPVWVTVRVPRDAKPGSYSGRLTIDAGGPKPVEVPVELSVADFVLAEPRDFGGFLDVVDSPRSLALKYNVPMWSEEHWKLVERNFELMSQVGAKAVYITILPDTYFGNGEGMIRWAKGADGKLTPDFGPVDRYLDLAVKHLGKVPVVCAYLWDRRSGTINYTGGGIDEKQQEKGVPITLLDPATRQLSSGEGPKWGTPEAREFWKPVVEGVKDRLAKRGIGKSLMWGLATDRRPRKETMDDLKALAPEVPWVCHTHPHTEKIHGNPVGYLVHVWGATQINSGVAAGRKLGWQNPMMICTFPRQGAGGVGEIFTSSSPLKYRAGIEGMMVCGYRGLGRIGAEFWEVLPGRKGQEASVLRTTPDVGETWGIGFDASISQLFAPGKTGPVATVRYEMFRENLQEIEARIFLEKLLSDPAAKGRLGGDLAAKCQTLLDERGQAIVAGGLSPGWLGYQQGLTDRAAKLYAAAAEVAGRTGKQ